MHLLIKDIEPQGISNERKEEYVFEIEIQNNIKLLTLPYPVSQMLCFIQADFESEQYVKLL
jgi:hypothetical protein